MAGGLFEAMDLNAIYLSRADANQNLGTWSAHPFVLDGKEWPTAEHYYQAMKFEDEALQEKIRLAPSPKQARKLGRRRLRKPRQDWARVKAVFMTRALYTKCKSYSNIANELLATEDKKLVENSAYDYFWGCGRDRLGGNMYGKVLMNVRNKLREELKQNG